MRRVKENQFMVYLDFHSDYRHRYIKEE